MNQFLRNILGDSNNDEHRLIPDALVFDGVNDYLRLPDTTMKVSGKEFRHNTAWTLEAIANTPNITPPNHAVLFQNIYNLTNPYGYPANNLGFQVAIRSGFIRVLFSNNTTGTEAIYTDIFPAIKAYANHFVITNDGLSATNSIKIYINGKYYASPLLQNNITNPIIYDKVQFITFGANFSTSALYAGGKTSKFRIGTGVATTQQIRDMFNFKTDNIYNMDILDLDFASTAANNVPDLSGNGNNGTLFNSANTVTTIY